MYSDQWDCARNSADCARVVHRIHAIRSSPAKNSNERSRESGCVTLLPIPFLTISATIYRARNSTCAAAFILSLSLCKVAFSSISRDGKPRWRDEKSRLRVNRFAILFASHFSPASDLHRPFGRTIETNKTAPILLGRVALACSSNDLAFTTLFTTQRIQSTTALEKE